LNKNFNLEIWFLANIIHLIRQAIQQERKERKTEKQKDRKTDRHKDRKTERQKDIKTERQKDRKTEIKIYFSIDSS
jgi:hypothetical protein